MERLIPKGNRGINPVVYQRYRWNRFSHSMSKTGFLPSVEGNHRQSSVGVSHKSSQIDVCIYMSIPIRGIWSKIDVRRTSRTLSIISSGRILVTGTLQGRLTGENKMDRFFTQTTCDRCGRGLDSGRIMSMYNTQCICLECSDKEQERPDYKKAVEADHEAIKKGNYNYTGIGFPNKK